MNIFLFILVLILLGVVIVVTYQFGYEKGYHHGYEDGEEEGITITRKSYDSLMKNPEFDKLWQERNTTW